MCKVSFKAIQAIVKVQNMFCLLIYIYPIPMLLFMHNSDSPSTVEQLSQGPSFSYNNFFSDSF